MFTPHPDRPRALLIGEGAGIGSMIYLADQLRARQDADWKPLVLLGSEGPFPFRPRPSLIVVSGIPDGCIACMPLLDEWGVASRLASSEGLPGCFEGSVTELAEAWLRALSRTVLVQVEMFACGPTPMLELTFQLAQRFGIPMQVTYV
ncbi:MAG: hypothetical protein JO042_03670 [Sinobacteraceae bacterium]|nr:hypothetical protein [Nevskiaceae bacterium]